MTAIGPYTQALNFTSQSDIRPAGKNKIPPSNTITGFLDNHKEFTIFRAILYKSGYAEQYRSLQNSVTVFIPRDSSFGDLTLAKEYVENMDILTARKLVQFASMNRRICSELLTASPHRYFTTKLSSEMMDVMNLYGDTIINSYNRIVKFNICVDNGVLHIVEKLLVPPYLNTASYYSQSY